MTHLGPYIKKKKENNINVVGFMIRFQANLERSKKRMERSWSQIFQCLRVVKLLKSTSIYMHQKRRKN